MGISPKTKQNAWLLAGLACFYVAVYAAWYPRTFSILDEQAYLSFAVALTKGTVFADVAGVDSVRTMSVGEHSAPMIGLGTSLLFAPVVNWNWRASFAIILATHLIGWLACAGALRKVELPVWYSVLYLLHPVAALYSRTVMSDVPTMSLMMLGLWMYLGPGSRPFLAGFFWGLMPHFRFAQVVTLAVLGAGVFSRDLVHGVRVGRIAIRRTLLMGMRDVSGSARRGSP